MVFVFDIDQTIFDSKKSEYQTEDGKVHVEYTVTGYYVNMMEAINSLYDKGHIIILQTARHWDKFEQTKKQVEKFRYHSLVMGNIPADMYVNDKNKTPEEFMQWYHKFQK